MCWILTCCAVFMWPIRSYNQLDVLCLSLNSYLLLSLGGIRSRWFAFFWLSLSVLSLSEVFTRATSQGRVPHHYTVAGITGVCWADESHTITPSRAALSVIQRMSLLGFLVNIHMDVLLLRRQSSIERVLTFFFIFSLPSSARECRGMSCRSWLSWFHILQKKKYILVYISIKTSLFWY